MVLEENTKYKGIVNLSWIESAIATNDMITKELCAAGFKNVNVIGNGKERTATGVWAGKTQEVDKKHLQRISNMVKV